MLFVACISQASSPLFLCAWASFKISLCRKSRGQTLGLAAVGKEIFSDTTLTTEKATSNGGLKDLLLVHD